jgi:hypothetical protein
VDSWCDCGQIPEPLEPASNPVRYDNFDKAGSNFRADCGSGRSFVLVRQEVCLRAATPTAKLSKPSQTRMPHFAREKVDSKKQTKKFRKNELTNSLKTKKDGIQISNPTPKRISGWTSARKVTEGTVRADMGRMTELSTCSLEVSSSL